MPGTTIDSTDTPFKLGDKNFILIDTRFTQERKNCARSRALRSLRSLKAISGSDVACLMLDYGTGLTNQDLHVSQYILDAGKGLIIAVNKTDLMTNHETEQKNFWIY